MNPRHLCLGVLLAGCAPTDPEDAADTSVVDSDGATQGGRSITCFPDRDGDGVGAGEGYTSATLCVQLPALDGAPWVRFGGDCDDRNPAVRPGVAERCNGIDDDCNGTADDGLEGGTWYRDFDGDGYGADGTAGSPGCKPGDGWVDKAGDCWDADDKTYPGAPDPCEVAEPQVDNDCDGSASEDGWVPFFPDLDGDGYGAKGSQPVQACTAPTGHRSTDTDCNDDAYDVNPGEWERCDAVDHDCNGSAKNGGIERQLWLDADGDGWGSGTPVISCSTRTGWVTRTGDCNDYAASTFPGATEVCNEVDDDCEGGIDEGFAKTTWYRDADGDGYGNSAVSKQTCLTSPSGYVRNSTDCDDANAARNPGKPEIVGNGIDEDCKAGTGP